MFRSTFLICTLAMIACTYAAPIEDNTPEPILRQSLDGPNPDGSYSYSYETAHGIQVQEEGHLENVGTDTEAIQARGSYSYMAPDGSPIQVTYVAGADGYHPEGAHLPTAPPVPVQILKALEYIATHPQENAVDEQ